MQNEYNKQKKRKWRPRASFYTYFKKKQNTTMILFFFLKLNHCNNFALNQT